MRLHPLLILCVAGMALICGCSDDGASRSDACDADTYISECSDATARTVCRDGHIANEPCLNGTTCSDGLCRTTSVDEPPAGTCDPATYRPSCLDARSRTVCRDGAETTDTCPEQTACSGTTGLCEPLSQPGPNECDESTYRAECVTPKSVRTCSNGTLLTTSCPPGSICNGKLTNQQCRKATESIGQTCEPSTFAESCVDNEEASIACIEQEDGSYKVEKVSCKKTYGDKYKCDVAFDFLGRDTDVSICYSSVEACDHEGDVEYECRYEDMDDNYRQFYSYEFTCLEFNAGLHLYNSDIIVCGSGKSCSKKSPTCDAD